MKKNAQSLTWWRLSQENEVVEEVLVGSEAGLLLVSARIKSIDQSLMS